MLSGARRPLRVILIWVLLELIAAAQVQRGSSTVLGVWMRWIGVPVVATATGVVRVAEDLIVGLGEGSRLVGEHRQLREQLDLARAREKVLRYEISQLIAERQLASTGGGYARRALAVRCRYRGLRSGRLEITGGAREGLQPDQPVLSAAGVVGRVWRVVGETSWVQLLTAPAAAVAVSSRDGSVEALAVGRGDGRLSIRYVPREGELFVGQMLLSSGADGLYPAGLPVARIVDIRGSDGAFLDVAAEPTTDIGTLRVALVLRGWRGGKQP